MQNVFDYIATEKNNFQTQKTPVVEGWEWSMFDHIKNTVIYKYGQYLTGKTDDKPNKNIILPILRLRYRTEGFDLKDIELFVENKEKQHLSFFVKKFHEWFARKEGFDTLIDEGSETDIDFGGVLVKDTGEIKPEVVPWQRIAFCDSTDVLSGPICECHQYSPQQLLDMKKNGWQNVDELIAYSESDKVLDQNTQQKAKTPGKYIEVYELHGYLPSEWLGEGYAEGEYVNQVHICSYYNDMEGNKNGITLYRAEERESPYKFRADKIFNRALGYGGVEELIEPQVWVNYGIIREKGLLDAVSKIIYQTADAAFANRNKTGDLESGEILVHEEGKPLSQIPMSAPNMVLFQRAISDWEAHARQMGAATESIMGEQPSAGTPFKLQELITQTSLGLHTYRMGKYAVFVEEWYRDWIIPKIVKELNKGQEWLAELTRDEMQFLSDKIVQTQTENMVKEMILSGKPVFPQDIEAHKQMVLDEFQKGGNKRFLQLLKNELKHVPVNIRINIKGKQKDLVTIVDKLTNVFRTILANPQGFIQMMQIPALSKTFSEIIEYSGLDPIDFSNMALPPQVQTGLPQAQTQPLQNISTQGREAVAVQ